MSSPLKWLDLHLIFLICIAVCQGVCADDGEIFFESKIRPIFVARCIECHGEKKQEGGLRLDSRAAWQAGGESGSALIPGDVEASRLIEAVRYKNSDFQMPPTKKLSDREISDLEAWVKIGAPDPREGMTRTASAQSQPLWSLQPIVHVQPPLLPGNTWIHQPIDCFILDGLQHAGLRPSPSADRRILFRRAALDLTGLLPTFAEVEAFAIDSSADAYTRLLDRLLASPQYGEHWARHWLDVARYSDTKGYVYAREEKRWVHASAYRDWVVRAFNGDLPYDRFVRLQIAADQIVPVGSPDLAAMGFLTLGRRFLGVTHDIIDDRIDVVTRGLLGLSVACARCHDHKYDPVPTRDYYSLYGVFQSCSEQLVSCGESADEAFVAELNKRETARRENLAKRREEQSARVRSKVESYLLAQLQLELYPEEVFNQIVEPDDINPSVVRKWQAFLARDKASAEPIFAKWHELGDARKPHENLKQLAVEYGAQFAGVEKRWREHIATSPDVVSFSDPHDERLRKVLYGIESPCHVPDEHIANIEIFFPTNIIDELWKSQGEVDRWLMENASSPIYATILVDRQIPSSPRVFLRGNPLTKGDAISRHFLTALGGNENNPFEKGSGRLEMANAIASPTNPLTARVIVNRVWMHHFGRGLVDTPSDFGNRAEIPSHPELLDWLATEFIRSGWSIKWLHRTIMLSNTYQQGNQLTDDPEAAKSQQLDPSNRWLSRMTSKRLSFEQARDAWLKTADELDLRFGGKALPLFSKRNCRRTIYANVDREDVSPVLRMFDFANPDLSIAKRTETSVPQQALFAMNHPFIADRATQLINTLRNDDLKDRVEQLYAAIYQRLPTRDELALAIDFINSDPDAEKPSQAPNPWSYGYGQFDSTTGRLANFTPLPHFSGSAWQGGESYPDTKLGWLQLNATGGHPGNDLQHAVVLRWSAKMTGNYAIVAKIKHEPEAGDGIRAFVSHSSQGLLRSATLHHSMKQIDVESIQIQQGETIDFIVDIREGLNSDQFLWSPKITYIGIADTERDYQSKVSDAEKDFTGESKLQLNRWQQLAQILMLANEFMFVD